MAAADSAGRGQMPQRHLAWRQVGLFPKTGLGRAKYTRWGAERGGGPVCAVCEQGLVYRKLDTEIWGPETLLGGNKCAGSGMWRES